MSDSTFNLRLSHDGPRPDAREARIFRQDVLAGDVPFATVSGLSPDAAVRTAAEVVVRWNEYDDLVALAAGVRELRVVPKGDAVEREDALESVYARLDRLDGTPKAMPGVDFDALIHDMILGQVAAAKAFYRG